MILFSTVIQWIFRLLNRYDAFVEAGSKVLRYHRVRGKTMIIKTKYKDSVSGLYFYDKNVSSYIKMLSKPVTEQYLILRGVIPIDKVV